MHSLGAAAPAPLFVMSELPVVTQLIPVTEALWRPPLVHSRGTCQQLLARIVFRLCSGVPTRSLLMSTVILRRSLDLCVGTADPVACVVWRG